MLQIRSPLEIEVELYASTTVLTLTGELDGSNVLELSEALERLRPAPGSTVLVDVGKLSFLGVCGLQALIFSAYRLQRTRCALMIARSRPIVRAVLHNLGADPDRLLVKEAA